MPENRERLIDATRRLLAGGTSEKDATLSMTEVGLSEIDALSIVAEAKSGAVPIQMPAEQNSQARDNNEKDADFWESGTGKFFPQEQSRESKAVVLEQEKKAAPLPYHRIGIAEFRKITPVLVGDFDKLIEKGGLKRGDTTLLSGGAGTGKTTFAMQFLYNGAKIRGEKGIYVTLEESPQRIKENMTEAFGWDIDSLEAAGLLAIIRVDPLALSRIAEADATRNRGELFIDPAQLDAPFLSMLPFVPDRLVIDSLSSISVAFSENSHGYRQYVLKLFDAMEKLGSVNFVLDETAQNPLGYSRTGIEEFLADGVLVFYSLKSHNRRETSLEILKLRSSAHVKRLVPYKITRNGFEVYADQEAFYE